MDLIKGKGGREPNLAQLLIRGLKRSKAASNHDGGLSILISFLERKANERDTSRDPVRIRKVCLISASLAASLRSSTSPSDRLLRSALVTSQLP
jgi:hypothetical protein